MLITEYYNTQLQRNKHKCTEYLCFIEDPCNTPFSKLRKFLEKATQNRLKA